MSWDDLTAQGRDYYAVVVDSDCDDSDDIPPRAILSSKAEANLWVSHMRDMGALDKDDVVHVMEARRLSGQLWNSIRPVPGF